ncbi:unnamed protein product [Orchesella dallaii]|uniref:Ig-like domain-containing protein n=1 Tax=Orchesella dallaii TaxID=48710 RepID=A0ABP1RDW8_9HEXA
MSKIIRKTSTTSEAILILLSLLVYGHVLCFLLSSAAALAHNHHHHHHHHHQHEHSSSKDAAASNRSSHSTTGTRLPWKAPASSRGNSDGGTRSRAGEYPIHTESQKGKKISSRTTIGQVDSRHISEHGHSAVSSTYLKDQNEDAWGMKKKTRESEEEFGWRGNENEMSDQAFLKKSKEMLESFGPSAVTNLAWKSLHSEISKDSGSNVGHWDDPEGRGTLSFPKLSHKPSVDYDKSKGSASPAFTPSATNTGSGRPNVCSPQDFEILKGELFQYDMGKLMNHIKLMTSVSNEAVADATLGVGRYPRDVGRDADDVPSWSDSKMARSNTPSSPPPWLNREGDGPEADKDNLLHHIWIVLDRNHDNNLEYIELYKAELENRLELQSPEKTGCQFRDFLLFDDTDHDGQLHVNEFFSSFSHFYDITMISLDKALETKHTQAVEGDTVVLQCDITGSPPPYIHWKRYEADLSQMASLGMKSSIDGTLSLTNVHMAHAGHFSCQSPRNPEVVQTHILSVETQPYVLITPKASWKRPGEDLLLICRLVLPVIESSSEKEIATGFSDQLVNWTWLFNGIPLRELPGSDNNNKYIFENSSSPTTRMSRLRIREIYFQDMGSYSCQAENSGGIGSDTASLVIIDPNSKAEMQALHNTNARQLLVFHQNGLASYSAEHCGWLWEIFGDDIIQNSKEKDVAPAVCDQFHSFCDWGEAAQVSPNYVYAAQPSLHRVLLIDAGAVQSVGNVLGTIPTCRSPGRMEFVPYTDQLWIRCEEDKGQTLFSVVENASKGDHHQKAIQFPLQQRDDAQGPERIRDIYLPSHQDGKRGKKDCQFAYVSFSDEQSLKRVDLKTFTYHKNSYLNLTKFSCVPHQIHFSVSCTLSIINCLDPKTKVPNGQVILDTLSNSVRFKTSEISGTSIASSDNRILLTEKHLGNNTHVFVQRIGAYEIHLLSHFLLSNKLSTARIIHSSLTDAYSSVAKLSSGKEVILSLETGEIQSVDEASVKVPHNNRAFALYPADNTFPLKTENSVIVMDGDTLRPKCKFYEEIPELHSFLTVQT